MRHSGTILAPGGELCCTPSLPLGAFLPLEVPRARSGWANFRRESSPRILAANFRRELSPGRASQALSTCPSREVSLLDVGCVGDEFLSSPHLGVFSLAV